MIRYNIEYTIFRNQVEYKKVHGIEAAADKGSFPLDTDIREGDILKRVLPNGNEKEVKISSLNFHQSPFTNRSGRNSLDHIEATFSTVQPKKKALSIKFEIQGLHPEISSAAGSLFADGHFNHAVLNSFKKIENRVQTLAKSNESGQSLMSKTFGKSALLDMSMSDGVNADNENEGFKFLLMGSMVGIRNPRAHGSDFDELLEQEAMEYLGFASLIMRRLDNAEVIMKMSEDKIH